MPKPPAPTSTRISRPTSTETTGERRRAGWRPPREPVDRERVGGSESREAARRSTSRPLRARHPTEGRLGFRPPTAAGRVGGRAARGTAATARGAAVAGPGRASATSVADTPDPPSRALVPEPAGRIVGDRVAAGRHVDQRTSGSASAGSFGRGLSLGCCHGSRRGGGRRAGPGCRRVSPERERRGRNGCRLRHGPDCTGRRLRVDRRAVGGSPGGRSRRGRPAQARPTPRPRSRTAPGAAPRARTRRPSRPPQGPTPGHQRHVAGERAGIRARDPGRNRQPVLADREEPRPGEERRDEALPRAGRRPARRSAPARSTPTGSRRRPCRRSTASTTPASMPEEEPGQSRRTSRRPEAASEVPHSMTPALPQRASWPG